jgi:hypothetical protein
MNEPKHPRAVVGLILLAILFTMLLGLQDRSSAPLDAYSPASPLSSRAGTLRTLPLLRTLPVLGRVGTRVFWLQVWPWVVVGLVGFGLLAWAIAAASAAREKVKRMERDR